MSATLILCFHSSLCLTISPSTPHTLISCPITPNHFFFSRNTLYSYFTQIYLTTWLLFLLSICVQTVYLFSLIFRATFVTPKLFFYTYAFLIQSYLIIPLIYLSMLRKCIFVSATFIFISSLFNNSSSLSNPYIVVGLTTVLMYYD